MVSAIKNLYQTPDLTGEALVKPLKKYQKTSTITKIFTAIIAYPALGLVAVVGLAIKLTGVCQLRKGNQFIKDGMISCQDGLKKNPNFVFSSGGPKGVSKFRSLGSFKITRENADRLFPQIFATIDEATSAFRRVYPEGEGSIKNGIGEIRFKISVLCN